jgi:hypothetical protein
LLADFGRQRKQIDYDHVNFPLEHLNPDRPHILFPIALQSSKALQGLAQLFGTALETAPRNAIDGDAIAVALRGRFDFVQSQFRKPNRKSVLPT